VVFKGLKHETALSSDAKKR